MKAICGMCGKKITLVHPTKKAPEGARLRRHLGNTGRSCLGYIERKVK